MCPTDQSVLTDTQPVPGDSKPAAAPAPAKEPVDTRTLEEKLFAPLPKRAADPAPVAKTPPPMKAPTPPPVAKQAPGSTTKVMETVFEDPAPQKSSKMAAVAAAQEIPWNKIIPAALAVVVIIAALFIFRKPTAPPPAAPELGSSIDPKDVDMEMNVRGAFAQNAALRTQDIQVRVKDGTVILTGEASSAVKIEQAVKAAKALPGVTQVVNHMQINPNVGVHSEGHTYSAGGLQPAVVGDTNGLAEQAKAHQLVLAGDRAAAHGDYKSAASFYKQALTLNPDDTAASVGYTQAMEKMQ
jgi:hypothetical protein